MLNEELNIKQFSQILRRLNQQNEKYVHLEGLTKFGFRHLMYRFAVHKKWQRCWEV